MVEIYMATLQALLIDILAILSVLIYIENNSYMYQFSNMDLRARINSLI